LKPAWRILPWTQPVEHGSVVQQPTNFEPEEHAYLVVLGGVRWLSVWNWDDKGVF
jgi:hypothetical protein